ncbi:UNVERIFIED_CONTAM: hypothetical protein PYX00_002007 [Menopon gallinae]|uniref:Uncharacterized protein n=1 Tax=Menopon gallinae TaxID=328185 RepID=A0AAW2IFK1_9NEOP
MSVSMVENRICVLIEVYKMSKPSKLDVADLIQGLKGLTCDDAELVAKSPMRTHECSHYSKPYEYPQSSTSRSVGGITRVVEADPGSHRGFQQLGPGPMPEAPPPPPPPIYSDVDIRDINTWLSMCSRDPQVINDFIAELNRKDTPQHQDGSFTTLQQFKADGISICSNSSSQISSPAQSPSEQNVTSPESVTFEDNSLYHSMSPIIPSLACINIKPVDDPEDIDRLLAEIPRESGPLKFVDPNVPGRPRDGPDSASPNIGTLMLNLAADNYESTIDLSQFAGTVTPEANFAYSAVEKECLNKKLDPKEKQRAWARISQINVDSLGKGDAEGDTQLMIMLAAKKVFFEYIYVIVERLLKENPKYLSSRNDSNEDALYLAAMVQKQEPLIAGYIAESFIRGKQDVNKKYNKGNTLLHRLAEKGDTHAKVMERLVQLRNQDNQPAFDVNKKNNMGYTPLHTACKAHKGGTVRSYETVRVLLENGADCTEKDYRDENTPLHTLIGESCDKDLVRILLENHRKFRSKDGPTPTTIPNRQGNTALHLACSRNTLDIPVQKEVVEILLQHGAMIHLKNINGCVPSVLVDASRKQVMYN